MTTRHSTHEDSQLRNFCCRVLCVHEMIWHIYSQAWTILVHNQPSGELNLLPSARWAMRNGQAAVMFGRVPQTVVSGLGNVNEHPVAPFTFLDHIVCMHCIYVAYCYIRRTQHGLCVGQQTGERCKTGWTGQDVVLTADSGGSVKPCTRCGSTSHESIRHHKGLQDGDVAFSQITLNTC